MPYSCTESLERRVSLFAVWQNSPAECRYTNPADVETARVLMSEPTGVRITGGDVIDNIDNCTYKAIFPDFCDTDAEACDPAMDLCDVPDGPTAQRTCVTFELTQCASRLFSVDNSNYYCNDATAQEDFQLELRERVRQIETEMAAYAAQSLVTKVSAPDPSCLPDSWVINANGEIEVPASQWGTAMLAQIRIISDFIKMKDPYFLSDGKLKLEAMLANADAGNPFNTEQVRFDAFGNRLYFDSYNLPTATGSPKNSKVFLINRNALKLIQKSYNTPERVAANQAARSRNAGYDGPVISRVPSLFLPGVQHDLFCKEQCQTHLGAVINTKMNYRVKSYYDCIMAPQSACGDTPQVLCFKCV